MNSKYIRPRSLTWWASIAPLSAGVFKASAPAHGMDMPVEVIDQMTGNMTPAMLINLGLAGIGLRGALK